MQPKQAFKKWTQYDSTIDVEYVPYIYEELGYKTMVCVLSLIARFMGPTWGPSGADRTQVGPMLAPWTLLSGMFYSMLSGHSFPYCEAICSKDRTYIGSRNSLIHCTATPVVLNSFKET